MSDENLLRRDFTKTTAALAASTVFAPFFVHADDKTGTKNVVIGSGDFQYECQHNWGQLPDKIKWTNTHGVTIDKQGLIYIKHQSSGKDPMDTIVVFDPEGKYIRSFGTEYHTGGHGIDIREENGEEFLYLSDTQNRQVVKTTLSGEWIWKLRFPREPKLYDNLNKFRPTNVAFHPDGGFYIADGYGSNYIHQYDKHGGWIRSWGGTGTDAGKMKTPHGLWVDTRDPAKPVLVVCDRANARLQYFSLDGEHLGFHKEFSFPAHIDIQGKIMLVPDLHARVTLLNEKNEVIDHLGYNADWTKAVLDGMKMRSQPDRWENGKFVHPHDACFDKDGNIFVVEWVQTGRVTKLRKV